jgi:hypothetical protein
MYCKVMQTFTVSVLCYGGNIILKANLPFFFIIFIFILCITVSGELGHLSIVTRLWV